MKSYAFKAHRVLRKHDLQVEGVIVDAVHLAPYNLEYVNGFRLKTPSIPPQVLERIKEELSSLGSHPFNAEPYLLGVNVDVTF